ncbi:MAG: glycosyltransferase family 39 protein [Candidatus Sumerlaeia bacterium]|nr:glycosyltransferase family 39 protein [Candidatus Sumerlaeia bacterium]
MLLFLLLIVAFVLRASDLGLVAFQIDEATASAIATQIAHGRNFPLAGIRTSFGFQNPPLLLYLLAPFFAISRDPVVPALFLATLGTSAVYLAWRSGMLLAGRPAAWTAALLIAFSPNAIEHCRRLWGHDLQVFFAAVAVYTALLAWRRRRWLPLAISFLAAGAAQSVHLSGALLWFAGGAVLLSGRPPRWWWAVVVGIAGVFLIYLPWLIHDIRQGFHDLRIIVGLILYAPTSADLGLPVFPFMAWALVLGDFWTNDLLGDFRPWMLTPLAGVIGLGQTLLALTFLGAAIHFFAMITVRRWHGDDRRITPVLVMFFPASLSLVFFGMLMTGSVPAYHLPALFPVAIMAAWGIAGFWRRRYWRPCIVMLLLLWVVVSMANVLETRRAIANGLGTSIPLDERKEVVLAIATSMGEESFHLAQDGRRRGAGLDVAWIYLFYWVDIHEQYTTDPMDADHVFVLIDDRSRLRPPVDYFVRSQPGIDFPHQSLHMILRHDRGQWLELLERYPPPSRDHH